MKNKKIIILSIIIILLCCVIAFIVLRDNTTPAEKEVIEIINTLNSDNLDFRTVGDWSSSLHVNKVIEVKKVDINLLSDEYKGGTNNSHNVYMMNLEERTYGNIQIVVVDGKVTANSLTGETYEDLWNSNAFTNDKFDIDNINRNIK